MKHTKGEWITKYREAAGWEVYNEDGNTICSMGWYQFHNSVMNPEIEEANAKLITEAGNVTNETGYTPRQLAEQKAELLNALIKAKKLIKDWHNIDCGINGDGLWAIYDELSPDMQPINEAIKKATS